MDAFVAFGLMGCIVVVCNKRSIYVEAITAITSPFIFTMFSLSTFFGDLKGVSDDWKTVIYLMTSITWIMLMLFFWRNYRSHQRASKNTR
jgi:low affinity Fe/Cu permease